MMKNYLTARRIVRLLVILLGLICLPGTLHAVTPGVSVGLGMACAVQASGKLHCWQYSDYIASVLPIPSVTNAASVSVGGSHACYTSSTGGSFCWGANAYGQLGQGDALARVSPTVVPGLDSGVLTTQVSWSHSCALLVGGAVKCWGDNSLGQLGDADLVNRSSPTTVAGLPGPAIALSVNPMSSCVIVVGGDVWCWGRGQTNGTPDGVPGRISPAGLGATQISSDQNALCALTSAGAVYCHSVPGELGPVAGLSTGIVQIALGGQGGCALHVVGDVYCWGLGQFGILGAATSTLTLVPQRVAGVPPGVTSIAAGYDANCLTTVYGGVKCWGRNDRGQLGDIGNELAYSTTPAMVTGLPSPAVAVSGGLWGAMCAESPPGEWRCWGPNGQGLVGDGTFAHRWQPADKFSVVGPLTHISTGSDNTCAIGGAGQVWCSGRRFEQYPTVEPTPQRVQRGYSGEAFTAADVAVGSNFVCAHNVANVYCWGAGGNAMGIPGVSSLPFPAVVPGLSSPVSSVAATYGSACAVGANRVWCWGYNAAGLVGDGTSIDRMTPTEIGALAGVATRVHMGASHACALRTSGKPVCWGSNDNGELDGVPGSDTLPREATALPSNPDKLALGASFTCAVKAQSLTCIGVLRNSGMTMSAVAAQFPSDIVDIAATGDTFCALRANGQLLCVGDNLFGRLGRGTSGYRIAPSAFVPALNLWGDATVDAMSAPYLTGDPMTLTATLPGPSVGGTVTFKIDGAIVPGCAAVPLSGETAICSTVVPGVGTRVIAVEYSGDPNHPALSAQRSIQVTGGANNTTSLSIAPLIIKGQTTPLIVQVTGAAGTATGSVTITGAGVNCTVTLVAGGGQCTLIANALGVGIPLTATYTGDSMYRPTVGTNVLNVVAAFDANADGMRDGRDGLILARYLVGIRGAALIDGIDNTSALRPAGTAIATYLDSIKNSLDIDLDGRWLPTTDGVLLVRYLLGLRGTALTAGATGVNAFRTAPALVEAYIRNFAD